MASTSAKRRRASRMESSGFGIRNRLLKLPCARFGGQRFGLGRRENLGGRFHELARQFTAGFSSWFWGPALNRAPSARPCLRRPLHCAHPGSLKITPLTCLATPDPLRTHGRPSVQECRLRLKRSPPNASRRCPPFKSSTAARSCSYGLFPWAALLRFAFGQKIWHTIFFSSKPNFKIFPKLLLRRRASPSPKSWPVTVHPRYPAWSICGCWSGRIRSPTRCCGILVLLRRCPAHRLKNCGNSFLKAKQRRSWQLFPCPMLRTLSMLYRLP